MYMKGKKGGQREKEIQRSGRRLYARTDSSRVLWKNHSRPFILQIPYLVFSSFSSISTAPPPYLLDYTTCGHVECSRQCRTCRRSLACRHRCLCATGTPAIRRKGARMVANTRRQKLYSRPPAAPPSPLRPERLRVPPPYRPSNQNRSFSIVSANYCEGEVIFFCVIFPSTTPPVAGVVWVI